MSQEEIYQLFKHNGNTPLRTKEIIRLLNKSESCVTTCLTKMLRYKEVEIIKMILEYPAGTNKNLMVSRPINTYRLSKEYLKS